MTRVTVQDLRTARYCLKGARAWFARNGFEWAELVRDGIAAERLQATGDALVNAAVRAAEARERQERDHGR
ncbi:hypothetical protein [Amaricoccus macauensis]|uniref:hypothetical protein n=1 Tax=Amaricoccus macauensis TaxID=57001 RepID=UPI003C7DAFC0